jgi:hypothetical protein
MCLGNSALAVSGHFLEYSAVKTLATQEMMRGSKNNYENLDEFALPNFLFQRCKEHSILHFTSLIKY